MAIEIISGQRLDTHWTMLNTYAKEFAGLSNSYHTDNPGGERTYWTVEVDSEGNSLSELHFCGDKKRQNLFDEASHILTKEIQKQHS